LSLFKTAKTAGIGLPVRHLYMQKSNTQPANCFDTENFIQLRYFMQVKKNHAGFPAKFEQMIKVMKKIRCFAVIYDSYSWSFSRKKHILKKANLTWIVRCWYFY